MFDVIADQILNDVFYDIPEEAGPEYVAKFVLRRFREIMAQQELVLYQP